MYFIERRTPKLSSDGLLGMIPRETEKRAAVCCSNLFGGCARPPRIKELRFLYSFVAITTSSAPAPTPPRTAIADDLRQCAGARIRTSAKVGHRTRRPRTRY